MVADAITKPLFGGGQREAEGEAGRPRTTQTAHVETEPREMNHRWGTIQRLDGDRQTWRTVVAARHTRGRNGQKVPTCRSKFFNIICILSNSPRTKRTDETFTTIEYYVEPHFADLN